MIGEKIKKIRTAKGLSQEDLAKRAGISQPLVVKLESGKQSNTTKLAAIAKALGVSAAGLDPAYKDAPIQAPTPQYQELVEPVLWFSAFIAGIKPAEIERMKIVLQAAFPPRSD